MRNSNEVTVNLRLGDRLESLDLAGAFTTIDPFLERLVTDPAFRFRLPQPGFMEEFANVAALLRFPGGVSERLIFAEYADNIENLWDRLALPIYLRRLAVGPYVCATFRASCNAS